MATIFFYWLVLSRIRSVYSVETHYFIAVNASQYQNQSITITCPENRTCDLSCVPSYSCATLTVDATNALNLHIACDGAFSCSSMDVIGPNTTRSSTDVIGPNTTRSSTSQISISCTGESSCSHSIYRLSHANSVQIDCLNRSACYFATFFVRNTQHVSVQLTALNSGQDASIYADGLYGIMNVYCTGHTACNRLDIETERMTGDLNVFCTGSKDYMCSMININGANMIGNLNLQCNTSVWKGCGHANIFCPHSANANCSIYCSGRHGHECQMAEIYVMAPSYVNSDRFDLICEGETSCFNTDIRCFYDPTSLAASSPETALRYNYYDDIWSCDTYQCGCPWSKATNHSLCADSVGTDCNIDCVNKTNNGCEGIVIDASLSHNLYINCERNTAYYHDGCEGSTIICPQNVDNGNCVVTCGSGGCELTTIIAPNGSGAALYVDCEGSLSCEYTRVVAMNAPDLNFRLTCAAEYSCQYMNINLSHVDVVGINCTDEWSCAGLEMNIFSGPNQMDFNCGSLQNNATSSCNHAVIKAHRVPIDSTWNQYCFNEASCRWMYLDIISDIESNLQLSLRCFSAYSCAGMVFAAPNGQHASIDCQDTFSCGMGTVDPYRLGWDLSNFTTVALVCNSSNATAIYDAACNAHMTLTNVAMIDVYCNIYDCGGLIFAVEHAGDIYFDCDGYRSCYSCQFRAGFIQSLTMDCNADEACSDVDILVEDEYEYGYLHLQCNTSQSCVNMNFRCNGPREDTQYVYNPTLLEWECVDGTCCPFKSAIVDLCTDNTDCMVYCDDNGMDCKDKVLNGRNATSLTVYCGDCSLSAIYCPLLNGACTVYCSDIWSCSDTLIYYINDGETYYLDHNITLQCNNASNACLNTKLYAHSAGNIYFESITTNSSGVTIYGSYAQSITITCIADDASQTFGCSDLNAYGENVNGFVNVYCYGWLGCDRSYFYFEMANHVNIFASGHHALYYSMIRAYTASYLSVSCGYNDRYRPVSCYNSYIYFPETNGSLQCYGAACYKLNVYAVNDMKDISFYLDPCDICYSIDECISSDWRLSCGYSGYTQYVRYYGSYCSGTDYCDCEYVLQTLNESLYADHKDDGYCYTTTTTTGATITTTEVLTTEDTASTHETDMIGSYVETTEAPTITGTKVTKIEPGSDHAASIGEFNICLYFSFLMCFVCFV